jgi:tetratricopeptide (TPR) repeat protein
MNPMLAEQSRAEYLLGMASFEKKDYQEALGHFHRSLELDSHFKTCQRIAEVLYALGQAAEAETYIEKAFHLNPNNSQAATHYTELLVKRGFNEDAKEILDDILSRNPTYGPAKRLRKSLEFE